MSDYENELDNLYYADPEGVTARVVAEAAAVAAAEVAVAYDQRREEEFSRVLQGQTESAAISAHEALTEKYGKQEVDRLLPRVGEKITESPYLVPEDSLTSPSALAAALDDVFKLARGEQEAEDKANQWNAIKAARKNIFVSNGPLG